MPGGNVWHHSVSPTAENPTAASTLGETVSPDPSAWTAVVVLNEPLVAHRRRRQRRAARRRDRHRYRDPRAPVLHPSRGRHPYRRHAAPAVTVRPDGIDVHLERGTWRMAAVPSDDVATDVHRAVPLSAEAMIEARGAADRHVLRAADSATRGREDRVRALARSATLMIAAQCSADGGHSRRHPIHAGGCRRRPSAPPSSATPQVRSRTMSSVRPSSAPSPSSISAADSTVRAARHPGRPDTISHFSSWR